MDTLLLLEMENLSCKMEEVQLPLDLGKHEERVGITPQKTVEEGGEENPSVLKEKNRGGHQNIVARRNKEEGKKISPPNVKLPPKRPFGFPERYKSPTDSIMSPATRGLLARNKKYMRPMELPTYVPPKAVEGTVPSAGQPPM